MISFVYAKCDDVLREDLWDSLRDIAERYRLPWLIVGDLNYIVDPGEKKGGKPHEMSKTYLLYSVLWIVNSLIQITLNLSSYGAMDGVQKRGYGKDWIGS